MLSSTLTRGAGRTPWAGVTGHQFEEEFVLLGRVQVTWNGVYIGYRESMDVIRRNQPANSALNCEGVKLRQEVAKRLGASVDEVNVFASVDTCLDKKHGVDLFIDFRGATVTIDLTLSSKEGYKANVIVSQCDVEDGFVLAADRIAWAFRSAMRPSLRA